MQRLAILGTAAAVATVIAAVLTTSGGAQTPGERTFKVIEGAVGTFGSVTNPGLTPTLWRLERQATVSRADWMKL